jgi:NSS family neurotransmitter:Na+ symporter
LDAAAILPPDHGFVLRSFLLQLCCTATVILACAAVIVRGVRKGIEVVSMIVLPAMTVVTVVVMVRTLTLPNAWRGVQWYLLEFRFHDLTANVMAAAIGHAIFALSLGGTFMVVYGSYLHADERLARPAMWTVIGDTGSSLIAGLAIIPAVFTFGLSPASGPGLIFDTLPKVFAAMPAGWLFGALFFVSLVGAGYLSDIGALEVLVAGLTDNTRLSRANAVWVMSAACFILSIAPSINMSIFVPWDLTFGSGMQTLGSLLAVITVGWCLNRSAALAELFRAGETPVPMWMFYWIRFGIPLIIVGVGVYWLLTQVLRRRVLAAHAGVPHLRRRVTSHPSPLGRLRSRSSAPERVRDQLSREEDDPDDPDRSVVVCGLHSHRTPIVGLGRLKRAHW